MEIPLTGGAVNAHQSFTVQLNSRLIEFKLNYLQSGQWSVDLYEGQTRLAAGVMLEPNCNIIESNRLDLGQLVFIGENTTLDNLGVDNHLIYVAPNE